MSVSLLLPSFLPHRPHALKGFLSLLLAAALALTLAPSAWAQQTFTVTTTSDSGSGSLRQAMTQANGTAGLPADTVVFDLPESAPGYDTATGTWTVQLQSDLPDVVAPLYLDGTTQPGYDDRPLIDLPGSTLIVTDTNEGVGSDSFIGGLVLGGVDVDGADRIEIRGNYVGTDALGESGRGGTGIDLSSTSDVVIAQNVISGAGRGISIDGFSGVSVRIEGNFIGTNAAGNAAVPNGNGIAIFGNGADAVIGGTSEESRNVVSGNSDNGIYIIEGEGNVILGNYIGTNAAGDAALPNGGDGIHLTFDSFSNQIGGVAPGEGNVISGNQGAGVRLTVFTDFLFTNNSIRGNRIFQNGGLGIDLGSDGLTANDPSDADDGPNSLQNFPVLASADYDAAAGEIIVTYRVDSDPYYVSYPIAVDFYLSDEREGRVYLGTDSYTEADFTRGADKIATFAPVASIAAEDSLVATATDGNGSSNTSEFSAPIDISGLLADTTPPVCGPVEPFRNGDGTLVALVTRVADPESGIADVAFTTLRNLRGFAEAEGSPAGGGPFLQGDSQAFDPEATSAVFIRGERIDFTQGGAVLTTVANGAGLAALCDPVVEQLAAEVPERFALEGNAPNPFRSQTKIGFSLAEPAEVTLKVFDLLGRKVVTLVNEKMDARHYEVTWDGRDASGRALAPGVYLYRIRAGSFTDTGRTVLVR